MSRHKLRLPRAVVTIGVAALVATAACAGWAFTVILSPAPGVPTNDGYSLVTAAEGDVGSHLTLNAAASWNVSPVGTNEAAGVVTTVDAQPGQLISSGDRLYSVNLRPVVAAQGAVPAYRAIAAGDSGGDVGQLQTMLAARGFYSGAADGTAGSSTVDAIMQWQQSIGVEATGEVAFGDVVFVPELPARLVLAPDVVHRGATLSGGEAAVSWLGAAPVFTLPVSEAQSQQVSTGTRVVIDDGAGDTWNAVAAGRSETATGTVVISLEAAGGADSGGAGGGDGAAAGGDAPGGGDGGAAGGDAASGDGAGGGDGASICGAHCDAVAVAGQTLFVSRVVTVEPVHGVVVPSAAVQTDASEQVVVVDAEGVVHPVTVRAEAAGQSIVTGVAAGLSIRVAASAQAPAEAHPAAPAAPAAPAEPAAPAASGAP
ncbi:peptidoglycan-binding domain-containing protein [Subtercola endophyticus]|uniref:peptidoglycan-binding domain-containing protein n=1 Tax=Subtercola endophyticus TaxID=2895559 RepID=UPI00272B6001|nr:peptidoglycan-binding domain-containing protein [Subtercola endophyticus]